MKINTVQEARQRWENTAAMLAMRGVVLPGVQTYLSEDTRYDYNVAMDALPALTTTPNSGVPMMLTTTIDPEVIEILFAPTNAAKILGEVRRGNWTDDTIMFPVVEHTGEVSSYDDFSENGSSGANTAWPNRQSYLFQTLKQYGDRELDRAGLARLNWQSEIDKSAASTMNRFLNKSYFYGIRGLQNYGIINDPNLAAPITPATKAAGGVAWITNGDVTATANEIYADIQSLFVVLVTQSAGLINQKTPMKLCMSPGSEIALTATNTFNVNVEDLLKKNFPNITVENAVQYGTLSAMNPEGNAAGNLVQLVAENVEGRKTGFSAFNEKMRSHPIVRGTSSYKQKVTGGTWGTIVRMPVAFSQMVGV